MSAYIPALPRETVTGVTGERLDAIARKLGALPNMFRTMANAPVALEAYLALADVAAHGRLDARQREQIALAVGESNDCGYCVAAHAAIGGKLGLDAAQIDAARASRAKHAKDTALLTLARRIVETRGHVSTAELDAFKAAGHDDATILEVLVNVVLNIYTNYTNHLARTEIDFPVQPARAAA